jgi:creatine kinase
MDVEKLTGMEALDDEYIKSTRVRAGRSIAGLSLPPTTTRAERREVERLLVQGLSTLTGDLRGQYYPLGGMAKEMEDQMQADHFLFQKPGGGTLLTNAGASRDWPDARGIFHNTDKNFLVWINEEDHMRVISMQQGGDIKAVFGRWVQGVNAVEECLKANDKAFAHHERLGYFTTCPSNLGTGLRASMFVKLMKLGKDPHKLEAICKPLGLQPRGSSGEHSAAVGGWWDISNKKRMGQSEVELVQTMITGVGQLIAWEKECEDGKTADEFLPAAEETKEA